MSDEEKLKIIKENVLSIKVLENMGGFDYSNLILLLQYEMPFEETSEDYNSLKQGGYVDVINKQGNDETKQQETKKLLSKTINQIIDSEKNGNKATTVYADTISCCKRLINNLEKNNTSKEDIEL